MSGGTGCGTGGRRTVLQVGSNQGSWKEKTEQILLESCWGLRRGSLLGSR